MSTFPYPAELASIAKSIHTTIAEESVDRHDRPEIPISVVVPTWRRPGLISRCLAALMVQDLDPTLYEIIVCDDGPDATTRAVVQALQCVCYRGTPVIRYLAVTATQGPAGARNAGWRAARGAVIAFTDDDTIPASHWLRHGLAAMAQGAAAVAGYIEVPLPAAPTDYELDAAGLSKAEFATANCFVQKSALERVGGFDERYTAAWREDSDLHFKLLARGLEVVAARRAVVVHPVRPAPWGVSVSQQKKSQFEALLYKEHPRLYGAKIHCGVGFYYLTLLALLVGIAGLVLESATLAVPAFSVWAALTLRFACCRLSHTSHRVSHVLEMFSTSMVIPPLSVFWRLYGAIKYKVVFL